MKSSMMCFLQVPYPGPSIFRHCRARRSLRTLCRCPESWRNCSQNHQTSGIRPFFIGTMRINALAADIHALFGPEAYDRVKTGVIGDNDHFG